jgi:hypothetical protein
MGVVQIYVRDVYVALARAVYAGTCGFLLGPVQKAAGPPAKTAGGSALQFYGS